MRETKIHKNMAHIIRTELTTKTANRTDNFDRLCAEIRSIPMLTDAEEQELFTQFSAAESEAERQVIRERIASANLRFALSVAKKYSQDAATICDLVSYATIGLYKAVDSYDLTSGFRFISYAVHKIMAEFSEYFRTDANIVRRSNNAVIGSKDRKVAERLFSELHREPTEDEVAEGLKAEYGIEVRNRMDIVKVRTDYLSTRTDEDGSTIEEVGEVAVRTASTNGYEEEIEREDRENKVERLLATLPVSHRGIVRRAFGIGYASMSTARGMKWSRMLGLNMTWKSCK